MSISEAPHEGRPIGGDGPVVGLPAMYHHVCQVYARMAEEANEGLWEGHLTKLVVALSLPQPYYTPITEKLRTMGCIDQVKRGGGGGNSIWILHHEPTPALWLSAEDALPSKSSRQATPYERVQQQVRDLDSKYESIFGDYALEMKRLNDRIQNLESIIMTGEQSA